MKPDRIFLVRHGESQGNVDKAIYKDIPDYALQLTKLGRQQAEGAGLAINTYLKDEEDRSVQYYVSPFWRTRQTYLGIKKNLSATEEWYYEDPRLREQEWGQDMKTGRDAYKSGLEEERDAYGHFYYRFANGESCADVYDRVSDFMGTLHRDFQTKDFPRNVVIVTHGMTMRLFLMRWFHAPVEEFETWANPKNGEYYLFKLGKNEKYNLVTPLRTHVLKHKFQFPWGEDKKHFPYPSKLPYDTKSRQSSN